MHPRHLNEATERLKEPKKNNFLIFLQIILYLYACLGNQEMDTFF